MKEHAKLAMREKTSKQTRHSASQQRKFKADPMKFSKQLFEKKATGSPEFEEERAYNYFSGIYRDERRSEPVTALPGMRQPPNPTQLLSEDAPSLKEVS